MQLDEFFVTGEPLIYAGMVSIVLVSATVIFLLTYFKRWKWLWQEWLTTVDHKKTRYHVYTFSTRNVIPRRG